MAGDLPERKVLVDLKSTAIHELAKDKKTRIQTGSCELYLQGQSYFLKVNHYMQNVTNFQFAKMAYQKTISFFFYEPNMNNKIYVVSIMIKQCEESSINLFQYNLKRLGQLYQLNSQQIDSSLRARIEYVWPKYLTKQVWTNKSSIDKFAKQFGGFMGALSNLVSKPTAKIVEKFQQKKQEVYQKKVGDETKSKLKTVKQKAQNLNKIVTQAFRPIGQKAQKLKDSVAQSFETSNNKIIKGIRDFGIRTSNALNEGYRQSMGGNLPADQVKLQDSKQNTSQIDLSSKQHTQEE